MWAIPGFVLASIVSLTVVLRATRSARVRRDEYPWLLHEISRNSTSESSATSQVSRSPASCSL